MCLQEYDLIIDELHFKSETSNRCLCVALCGETIYPGATSSRELNVKLTIVAGMLDSLCNFTAMSSTIANRC